MAHTALRRLVPAFAFLALLAACSNQTSPEKFPEIGWSQLPAFKVSGSRLEVVKGYVPSDQPPHIETLTPRTLIDSADRWARDRLVPAGGAGWISFVIVDASVVEAPLEVKSGIAHAFDNQPVKRYDAHVAVRVEVHDVSGHVVGQVEAEASSSRTINQDSSQREISEAQYLVVQDAMLRLNQQLDTNIAAHLQPYLHP